MLENSGGTLLDFLSSFDYSVIYFHFLLIAIVRHAIMSNPVPKEQMI